MAATAKAPTVQRDMQKELAAAAALKDQLHAILGEDETDIVTLRDTIEGETGLIETVDACLRQIGVDNASIAGLKAFEQALGSRRSRIEKRVELVRAMLANALMIIELKRFERPLATITLKDVPPKLTVSAEGEVPAKFWKQPDPELNRSALTDALRTRQVAIDDVIEQAKKDRQAGRIGEEEHTRRLREALDAHPPIPGAELGNGGVTVQIRYS